MTLLTNEGIMHLHHHLTFKVVLYDAVAANEAQNVDNTEKSFTSFITLSTDATLTKIARLILSLFLVGKKSTHCNSSSLSSFLCRLI